MIQLKYYIRIFLFIVASSIFFSCNESDIGIFFGIESEEKIIDNSLPNEVTIGSMEELGGKLYIGAGKVYEKRNDEWRKIGSPSGFDLTTSIASNGGAIYAAFYDTEVTKKGLFKLVGDSWTQVDTSYLTGKVEMVKSANNRLFISTRISPNDGKLYYSNNGTSFIKILDLKGSTFHVTYHGGTYWFGNWNNLYTSNSSSNPSPITSLDRDYRITDLTPGFADNYIYFSARDDGTSGNMGYLYASNGSNDREIDDISYAINGLKCFSVSSGSETFHFLLAATEGRGYYYEEFNTALPNYNTDIDLEKPIGNNILALNYTSATDLHTSVSLDFFIVDSGSTTSDLYLMTATEGLWKNSESGGSRNWSIE